MVSGSALSPARKRYFKELISCFFINEPSGSILFIALNAVGAVNNVLTLFFSTTPQNAPASGVPTGFPSYKMEVQPANKGA